MAEKQGLVGFHSNRGVSKPTADLIGEKYSALKARSFAVRVWHELFDEKDRQSFHDLKTAFERLGTVGMWIKARNVSLPVAVLQLAGEFELISPKRLEKLTKELGLESGSSPPERSRPTWDRETGELTFRGEVVKRIRNLSLAKNVVKILNSFAEEGWPPRILDPLLPKRKHETLRSLNAKLERIHFAGDGTGEGILWTAHEG